MTNIFNHVLGEYERRAEMEYKKLKDFGRDDFLRTRDDMLLSINHETGQLLSTLARGVRARTIVEVGSSYGYSTLWLAQAAQATGGKLISLELHSKKQEYAREKIEQVGLSEFVDFRLGDARDT